MTPALNIILRQGLLPETQVYCYSSGAQDRTGIDKFIRALKSASLWGPLIECWILRSAYNAGTGTTAYGLKGSNGTLVNGPTWGTDGITFAATKHITTVVAPPTGQLDRTLYGFCKPTSTDGWIGFYGAQNSGQAFGIQISTTSILCARWSNDLTAFASAGSVFQSVGFSRASGTDFGFLDGVQQQSKVTTGLDTAAGNLIIGARGDLASNMLGIISLEMVFSANVNHATLNTIVRATVCNGL